MAIILTLLNFFTTLVQVNAKNLGVYGTVYPVTEEDLLEYLQNRAKSLPQEKLLKFQKELESQARKSVEEPKPVNVSYALKYRAFEYDPSIEVEEDIKNLEGLVVVKKGSYNPLDIVTLTTGLLFIDGTNEKHLDWARKQTDREYKWVLVKGRPIDLEEQEKIPVFFDQKGILVKRFNIKNIPAKVNQYDKSLLIEEIPIDEGFDSRNTADFNGDI